jgi:hypothetical protein
MQVVIPVPFNTLQLISSNATEVYAAYSAVTTYSKDQRVDYGTFIYQSLVNSNTGNQPDISPTFWIQVGPDNTHAMFDLQVSTQTTSTSPLIVTVLPGKAFNTVAGINVGSAIVHLLVKDQPGVSGVVIYDQTINLDNSGSIVDWYDYFFDDFSLLGEFMFEGIPPYATSVFTLTLSGLSPTSIGHLIYGNIESLGDTQYGINTGIRDFSIKETDAFGETTFVQRGFSKRFEAQFLLKNTDISSVMNTLQNIRATPALWIPSDQSNFSSLTTFGYYKEFDINIPYPNHSMCSIQIEGLI